MKLTLAFFGVSFTCLGGYMIFTLGAPEQDLEGNIIKDDLVHKNVILQYITRTYRMLEYYRRVSVLFNLTVHVGLTKVTFSLLKNHHEKSFYQILYNTRTCNQNIL